MEQTVLHTERLDLHPSEEESEKAKNIICFNRYEMFRKDV